MRVARENPTWGYTRLRGALKNLGHELGRNTIKRLLAEHGIAPAPERGKSMSWSTFIKAHWGAIAATDLFTVEVVNPFGLVRYHVLFVIDIATRCVCIGGITSLCANIEPDFVVLHISGLTEAGTNHLDVRAAKLKFPGRKDKNLNRFK